MSNQGLSIFDDDDEPTASHHRRPEAAGRDRAR